MRRGLVVLAVLGAAWAASPAAAAPQPATVAIDSSEAELSARDAGGWTARVGVTNLTDGPVTLSARAAEADPGCSPSLQDGPLPRAEHRTVTVVVPAGCKVADDGFTFELTTDAQQAAGAPLSVTAKKPAEPARPDWAQLHWFWRIFLIVLAATVLLGVMWRRSDAGRRLDMPLGQPDRTWSFSESWATNVTAIGGLLATFFSASGVIEAILGRDAESTLGLLTVGSAIAVGLAAAGPVAVLATKTRDDDALTPVGLLLGAVLTLSAAGGELWIAYRTGTDLKLGGVDTPLLVALILAALLLVVYAFRTLRHTLDVGAAPPERRERKRRRAARRVAEAAAARFAAVQGTTETVMTPQLLQTLHDEAYDTFVEYDDERQPGLRRRAAVL